MVVVTTRMTIAVDVVSLLMLLQLFWFPRWYLGNIFMDGSALSHRQKNDRSPKEYAERLAETTPFDENQGIYHAPGGDGNGTGTGSGNRKSGGMPSSPLAATPPSILVAPAWSLPTAAEVLGSAGKDVDNDDDDSHADDDGDDQDSVGGGFGIGGGGGGGDKTHETVTGGTDSDDSDSEAGDEEDEGEGEADEEGTGTRRACCLSAPQRPLHC